MPIQDKVDKVIWNPATYSTVNNICIQPAEELITEILQRFQEKVDVIFEIGCGTGNITNILSSRVRHRFLLACDISDEMISHANDTYKNETNKFIVQDFGVHWDNLAEEIRALEGCVDIVFSNFALHYMRDKPIAMRNIHRLLKKDGFCFANIADVRFLKDSETKELEKYIEFTTTEQQYEMFDNYFRKAGFEIQHSKSGPIEWKYPSLKAYETHFTPVTTALSRLTVSINNVPCNLREDFAKKLQIHFMHTYRKKSDGSLFSDESVVGGCQHFRFIARKLNF